MALPKKQRATLICRLLETLPAAGDDVSDAEVLTRDQEFGTKKLKPLSHKQFVRSIEKSRRCVR
jgi:hypothetical protein